MLFGIFLECFSLPTLSTWLQVIFMQKLKEKCLNVSSRNRWLKKMFLKCVLLNRFKWIILMLFGVCSVLCVTAVRWVISAQSSFMETFGFTRVYAINKVMDRFLWIFQKFAEYPTLYSSGLCWNSLSFQVFVNSVHHFSLIIRNIFCNGGNS